MTDENILALRVENVSKEYRLGTIGGGTLKGELQSRWAAFRGKEDPNLKIGQVAHSKNERFLALDDLSFDVKKGEAIGIIGHNGAGKSTILKLICRVTAPSKGNIYLNGRITSMLEVGTGFHGELTGKENIYLNGAILGMTKEEIDEKYDEIVEFSEVGQFINTPVKRYSSGMKVKLGFAVASHLNSEILIMDEVLAVGDVSFQNKCINQMKKVAAEEGRTILYVSHNMATIKSMCDRCIVLDHGKKVFDGDTQEAIGIYLKSNEIEDSCYYDVSKNDRHPKCNCRHMMQSIEILGLSSPVVAYGDKFKFKIKWLSKNNSERLCAKLVINGVDSTPVGVVFLGELNKKEGINECEFEFDTAYFVPNHYKMDILLYDTDADGNVMFYDRTFCMKLKIQHSDKSLNLKHWFKDWGNGVFPCVKQI